MTTEFSGSYPVEARRGEIERLESQAQAIAHETERLLDLIGVSSGWTCVDIGCGPGGIVPQLIGRVGVSGKVVGLDKNPEFLRHARAKVMDSNVQFILGDAYSAGLPSGGFDLVHMRFVASTSGDPGRLIEEAIRLCRPGGIVALQEPDGSTLNVYPPHPSWETLKSAVLGAFAGVGADLELARRLYFLFRKSGLAEVQFRPFIPGVRSTDPLVDYLPSGAESLRGTIVKLGLLTEAELTSTIEECRRHLAQPDTCFTMYTVAQVWGRKP